MGVLRAIRGLTLALREFEAADADWVAASFEDREFMRLYCSNRHVGSAEDLRREIEEVAEVDPSARRFIEFVVEHQRLGRIGIGALGDYSSVHRRAELSVGIVGIEHRNSRASVEATLLLVDLGFNHYGLNKIFSYVYGYNPGAEDATMRFGFRQEGTLKEHHWSVVEGRFVDLHINGLTLAEFRRHERIAILSRRLLGRDITRPPARVSLSEPAADLDTEKLREALLRFADQA